jgi:hypothetical protein
MLAAVRQVFRIPRSTLLLGMAVVALLAVAAVGSSADVAGGGHDSGSGATLALHSASGMLLATLTSVLVIAVASAGAMVYLLIASRRNKKPDDAIEQAQAKTASTWIEKVSMIVLALLLIGGFTVVVRASRTNDTRPSLSQSASPKPLITEPAATSAESRGGSLWVAIGIGAGTLVTVVAAFAFLLLPRLRRGESDQEASLRARGQRAILTKAVSLSLDDLSRETDPRRAIVAAYANMEHVLASAGLPRPLHETPTEYLRRILVSAAAPAQAVSGLTQLFQEARFSRHDVGESQRADALLSLSQIHDAMAS